MTFRTTLIYCSAIVSLVTDTSPSTVQSLSLTSQCLLEAVNVIRNRRRTIRFDNERKTYEPESFDPSTFTHTHHLTIEAPELSDPQLFNQTFIISILEIIQNLKTLSWNVGPISIDVLSALERLHPRCALRIFQWWRLDGDLNHLDETEVALTKFKNLTHFRYVTISDRSSAATLPEAYSWEPFQEIVAKSHRLELASFLSDSIFRNHDAHEWAGEAAGITKAGKERKRNKLKSLTIDCRDLRLSSSTLQEIDKFTDLSALEYLKVSRARAQDYFQVAATLLPNLKHISLNFSNSTNGPLLQAAGEYLRTCSPAQTLSLWGWRSVITIPDLIARHGTSLQVLQLHEKKDNGDLGTELDLSDVKLVMDGCPELTDVTIDLPIENADYNIHSTDSNEPIVDILRVLAARQKPQLRRVQIYLNSFELENTLSRMWDDAENDPDITPADLSAVHPRAHLVRQGSRRQSEIFTYRSKRIRPIVEPCVTAMWELIYGQRASGERLLDVKFGNWESGPPYNRASGQEARTFCQVKPHERDDRVGQCVVKTRLWSRYNPKGIEI